LIKGFRNTKITIQDTVLEEGQELDRSENFSLDTTDTPVCRGLVEIMKDETPLLLLEAGTLRGEREQNS
jgi:hypothetical protein